MKRQFKAINGSIFLCLILVSFLGVKSALAQHGEQNDAGPPKQESKVSDNFDDGSTEIYVGVDQHGKPCKVIYTHYGPNQYSVLKVTSESFSGSIDRSESKQDMFLNRQKSDFIKYVDKPNSGFQYRGSKLRTVIEARFTKSGEFREVYAKETDHSDIFLGFGVSPIPDEKIVIRCKKLVLKADSSP